MNIPRSFGLRRWSRSAVSGLLLVAFHPGVASAQVQEEQSSQGMVYGYVVAAFLASFCIYATLKSARRS